MRLARLAPLALAVLPAAAAIQTSEAQSADAASAPRAGQYRTTLDLVLFEVPGLSESALSPVREAFLEELGSGNDFCLAPGPAGEGMRRKLLEQIAEGACTFDRFATRGAMVSAAMSCTRESISPGKVTVDGRIWAENADVNMNLVQDFGSGPTRIVVRARSARVGDCGAPGNP